MYEVTTFSGDYTIETFETLEKAREYAQYLVDVGALVACRIYYDGGTVETVSLF